MSAFKPQQCRITIQDRAFHFVSYEGQPANVAKNQTAEPPMWYLMAAGRRFPTVACNPDHTVPDVEKVLTTWALANAMVTVALPPAPPRPVRRRPPE